VTGDARRGAQDGCLVTGAPVVRIAGPDDAPAIHALLLEFNGEAPPPEGVRHHLEQDQFSETVFLGEMSSQAAGLLVLRMVATLSDSGKWCEITEMYVRPPFRRMGVGTTLLQSALEHSLSHGGEDIHLLVDPLNHAAQAFYAASGFRLDSYEMQRKTHDSREHGSY
jgi:ribosomal protein S18 acetylase RimI-like enzyme